MCYYKGTMKTKPRKFSLSLHDHERGITYAAPKAARFTAASVREAKLLCHFGMPPEQAAITDAPKTKVPTSYYCTLIDEEQMEHGDPCDIRDWAVHESMTTIAELLHVSTQAVSQAVRTGRLCQGVFISTDASASYEGT